MRGYCTLLVATFPAALIACLSEPTSLGLTTQELDSSAVLHENFFADGDPGQCGGAVGVQFAHMGSWTNNVLIDADHRVGGCRQQFAVTDPLGVVAGLSLAVNFFGDGDATQCANSGLHPIPVTNGAFPVWGTSYGIDTDDRSGGCWQVFSVSGRSDIMFDVELQPTPNAGVQCGNTGRQTASSQRNASVRINTDDRPGGCTERFRLRRAVCGDAICDANENASSCPGDCEVCGNGSCGANEPGLCPTDCPQCGDNQCNGDEPFTCPSDCGFCDELQTGEPGDDNIIVPPCQL